MSQGKKPIVLLIEPDASLRRLMVLGLQHRGLHVIEASSPAQLPAFDVLDLLVLDLDGNASRNRAFLTAAQSLLAHPLFCTLPTILLAWEYPPVLSSTSSVATTTLAHIQYLTKPFDARVLYETVDQFLLARIAEEAAHEARAEELLLATYSQRTAASSVWPIVTAAGLFLTFAGMLLQVAVMVAGLLIVLVALLLWTLGSKPSLSEPMALNVLH